MSKLKIFISSTMEDLQPERDAVEEAISTFRFEALRAETIGAQPQSPRETCLEMTRECDIYIGICGARYGWIPPGDEVSVTETEFLQARKHGKDILIYVKEVREREKQQDEFLQLVEDFDKGYFRRPYFATPDELAEWVMEDLAQLVSRRYGRPGAVDPALVTKHLQAIVSDENYERWSDDRYIDEKARPLPMNVSLYDAQFPVGIEELPREDLIEAVEKAGKRVVILGDPGAGKTTALERLMWVTAKKSLDDPDEVTIPIVVPLNRYGGEEDLLPLLRAALNREGVLNLSSEGVEALLVTFPCFVLLDGLNEMGKFREEGAKALVKHMDTYALHRYCLTCRTQDYRDYQGELGPVRELVVQEMDDELGALWGMGRSDVLDYLVSHLGDAKGRNLYEKLRRDERLCSMARNPLLLYMIKEAGLTGELPTDRGQLIAKFVMSPKIQGRIKDSAIRGKVQPSLQALAWRMQEQRVLNYGIDQTFEVLEHSRGRLDYSLQDMLNGLKGSGLLVPVGDLHVRLLHQMLQEYFAAEALRANPNQGDVLYRLEQDEWWVETLVLYLWLTKDESLLLGVIDEPRGNLTVRIAAGNVLGQLGDPRFYGPYLEPDLVQVPDGKWLMGSTPGEIDLYEMSFGATGRGYFQNEAPAHEISLSAFDMAKYLVTRAQYGRFIDEGGYDEARHWTKHGWSWRVSELTDWDRNLGRETHNVPAFWGDSGHSRPNYPVVGVSWHEAVAYCRWLSEMTTRDYRLPTEAQWEKGARGTKDRRRWPWGDDRGLEKANLEWRAKGTTPVGIYPQGASPYGVLDMAGNVAEWTSSLYKSYPYDPHDGREDPEADEPRAVRSAGCCSYRGRLYAHVTRRGQADAASFDSAVGFRLVLLPNGSSELFEESPMRLRCAS